MATIPSPSKKAMQPSAPPAPTQPGDFRKSFQREASTGFEDVIRQRAVDSRHNVNRGYGLGQGVQPPRSGGSGRPLMQTQSMPVLSFAQQDSVFRTSNDVLSATFGDGHVTEYRTREVQPMWATPPSPASSQGRGANRDLRRHPSAGSASSSMVWPAPVSGASTALSALSTPATTQTDLMGGDDGGDGFDLDEVFGPSGGQQLGTALSVDDDSQQTVTQGIKRGFEGQDGLGEAEDEEMTLTDVEDDEMPSALPTASQSRPTAGNRRVLGRTQSVPASAFRGEYRF